MQYIVMDLILLIMIGNLFGEKQKIEEDKKKEKK